MKTIRLSQKTDKDGALSLVIPLGQPDREYEVVVVLEPRTPEGQGWPAGYFARTYGSVTDETFERPSQGALPEAV